MDTDAEVIRASWEQPRAFEAIFDRHHTAIRGYLVRRIGPDEGDDLAAEVFATAFSVRRRYRTDRANARPWLYGIANNLLRHHLRSRSRRDLAFARARAQTLISVDLDDVPEHLDADHEVTRALNAVARMDDRDREILLLAVWEELPYADIAEALGVPVGTVRSRLHRARASLRHAIRPAAGLATGGPDHA